MPIGGYILGPRGHVRRHNPGDAPGSGEMEMDHFPSLDEQKAVGLQGVQIQPLWEIHQDCLALSKQQQDEVWNDLNSGTPPKCLATVHGMTPAIFVAYIGTGADAHMRIAALYVQDYPTYLVNPPFDPTINIPGEVLL